MLGDDVPPDELNRVTQPGQHFGYPFCHGGTIADPEFGAQRACSEFVPPAQNLGPARRAARHALLHRHAVPARVSQPGLHRRARLVEPQQEDRLSRHARAPRRERKGRLLRSRSRKGWLQGQQAWGRPADVLVAPDGSLLVSDDSAGAIYRISYKPR